MSDLKSSEKKPKKRKSTARQRRVGKANLLEFRPATPAQSHGVHTFVKTGELPAVEGAAEVAKEVEQVIASFVSDLGGLDSISAGQKVILAGLRTSLTVQGLGELHLRRAGVVSKETQKPTALLTVLATFINSARLSALALGLARVPRKTGPTSLAEYLESRPSDPPETEGAAT
jgi:hypothetical protein